MKNKFIEVADKYYLDLTHPLFVANNYEEMSDRWIVGLFHDILEDTELSGSDLYYFLCENEKEYLFEYIDNITRKKECTYFKYIKDLYGISIEIKINDLKHHLSREETLRPSLKLRYVKALDILSNN